MQNMTKFEQRIEEYSNTINSTMATIQKRLDIYSYAKIENLLRGIATASYDLGCYLTEQRINYHRSIPVSKKRSEQ